MTATLPDPEVVEVFLRLKSLIPPEERRLDTTFHNTAQDIQALPRMGHSFYLGLSDRILEAIANLECCDVIYPAPSRESILFALFGPQKRFEVDMAMKINREMGR